MSGGSARTTPPVGGTRPQVPRRAVALTGGALLLALLVAAALTVPLDLLPGATPVVDVARDFTPQQVAREVAFHDALRPSSYASLALGLAVTALLALTPLGARVVQAVARPLGGGWVWQVVLGALALDVLGRVVTLPLRVRNELVLRDYGLSTQTWGSWALDVLRGTLVSAGLSSLVLLVLVGMARRAPRTWWAWAAAGVAGLVVAGSFVYPVVVEPVFNTFRPMPAGELRDDLLALAREDGVPVRDVLVADASRRTTALNAYVSGFGSTRRIVVYDTLLERATPQEVRLVVAHELGHAERRDVLVGTLLGALGSAAAVCLLALLLSQPRLLARAGAAGPGDPRVVPLLLALTAFGTLLVAPLTNAVSRQVEARADLHSLQLTGDVPTFVAGQRRLALANLSDLDPHPLQTALFATHSSAPERLALARAWQDRGRPQDVAVGSSSRVGR